MEATLRDWVPCGVIHSVDSDHTKNRLNRVSRSWADENRHCSLNGTEDLQGITNYNHAERREIVVVIRDKSETIATEAEIRPRIEHG